MVGVTLSVVLGVKTSTERCSASSASPPGMMVPWTWLSESSAVTS